MISINRKHLKIMSAALVFILVNTSVAAHNADALRKKREQLKCNSLINMNDSDIEQLGPHAINRKKLCVAKQRLRESREKGVHDTTDQPLGQATLAEDKPND